MQEWIVAMLVISVLLIIRDMACTILEGKLSLVSREIPLEESHPQMERVKKHVAAFGKLADSFYSMPYRLDYLSDNQILEIMEDAKEHTCSRCYQNEICWKDKERQMCEAGENLVRILEDGDPEKIHNIYTEWTRICCHAADFLNNAQESFQKERQLLIWNNRLIESRLAIAQQLTEFSSIIQHMAENLYEISAADTELFISLRKNMKKHQIILKNIWVMDKIEGRRQVFLTLRTRSGQCVPVSEAAQILSRKYGCPMVAVNGSRRIIGNEFHTLHFIEDVVYQILYGVAKLTKEKEKISGDNYICCEEEDGRYVLCLSDGMGSGMDACQESEQVVELLGQLMESGFSQEAAARMINTTLLMNSNENVFSTVDVCTIDLYSGICKFLKAGAATSFIKRDHWVECITSGNLAAGILQRMDFEITSRKLYHGDIIIMMTDGVLDALPRLKEEETMKEIIMDIQDSTPKEIGRGILERVLGYSDYRARDDMTILVAGMWRK